MVQVVGANTRKKDVNSYIKTVTDEGVTIEDTPNYTTYQIQVDMWARKMSDIDYLQELYLDNVDVHLPTLTIKGKDGGYTTQYMMPRDFGKNLDEQQRNDEKLYRRMYSYVIDVPHVPPIRDEYTQAKSIKVVHVWDTDNLE